VIRPAAEAGIVMLGWPSGTLGQGRQQVRL